MEEGAGVYIHTSAKVPVGTMARSAGAWKVMEYLRMIFDWLKPRGLVLTVIGNVIGKGLIGHHWQSTEKTKPLGGSSPDGGSDTHSHTNRCRQTKNAPPPPPQISVLPERVALWCYVPVPALPFAFKY